MNADDEIQALCEVFDGLECQATSELSTIEGVISFDAYFEALENIEDWFEIRIIVPENYPKKLPSVIELQGKVHSDYEHLYENGCFCLATPLAARQAFNLRPTLLGFVKNLVVPYLYSYRYWEMHGAYPFDDRSHGALGLIEHYLDLFNVEANPEILKGLKRIVKYGYRGHHPCPCGSGNIIRKCHKDVVREISRNDTRNIVSAELIQIEEFIALLSQAELDK